MHPYILETARLVLRPLAPGDAQAAFAWLGDPEVNRFMPYALYTSAEQAREWLERLAEADVRRWNSALSASRTAC